MMITKSNLKRLMFFSAFALLGACASNKGGGGDEAAAVSGTDELESLAASIDSGAASSSSPENDMQINENDLMSNDLNAQTAPAAKDDLSLDDASSGGSGELSIDDTLAAEDRTVADSGGGNSLTITASGASTMPLLDTPWLQEVSGASLGFSCKWKTLKDNGKVRHRVCSLEKQVVVNVLEKNRGTGLQLAKLLLDARGKAAFNRWKHSLKSAHFRAGKEKTKRNGNIFSRYMSPDHKSFVDLIWNGKANAVTYIMIPTAKGLGRELRKVAGK